MCVNAALGEITILTSGQFPRNSSEIYPQSSPNIFPHVPHIVVWITVDHSSLVAGTWMIYSWLLDEKGGVVKGQTTTVGNSNATV